MSRERIIRRINERLAALSITRAEAHRRAKLPATTIDSWMRAGRAHMPRIDTLEKLAPALETTPAWLAFGDDVAPPVAAAAGLPLLGRVSAGTWRDASLGAEIRYPAVAIGPDPRWPASQQFVLQVDGDSIDRVAQHGDYLLCLDCALSDRQPRDDDIVIVETVKEGSLVETMAKRYRRRGGLVELRPDSTNPLMQVVRVIDPATPTEREATRIRAVCLAVVKPLA